ncbi:binding protein [[Candida] boidinii]|nr:binding protein [[Candida] boidinii]
MTLDECPKCDNSDDIESIEINWIQCSPCHQWFHNHCLNITLNEVESIKEYHCPDCIDNSGPTIYKRKSSRSKKRIDYLALDSGEALRELRVHPHIEIFKNYSNSVPIENNIYVVDYKKDCDDDGLITDKTISEIIERTALKCPILIPQVNETGNNNCKIKDYYSIGMKFPGGLTVSEVTHQIGEDTPVEVMDVLTQNNLHNWNLGKWRDYYNKPDLDRDRIRNVISLEVSGTELGEKIQLPKFVRDNDIVQNLWNSQKFSNLMEKNENIINEPKVSKYVLMSVKDSFTDFHVDFGGTSVYYTVLRGKKSFLMYPPTPANLKAYQEWCLKSNQNSEWFGNFIKNLKTNEFDESEPFYMNNGLKIEVNPGDLLILPSGWIHAVYTAEDSLVIGGNFLTTLNLPTHLKIYEIESNIKVPEKYKFPGFLTIIWLIGYHCMENKDPQKLSDSNIRSMLSLDKFYNTQLLLLDRSFSSIKVEDSKKNSKLLKLIKSAIPTAVIGNMNEFVKKFHNWLYTNPDRVLKLLDGYDETEKENQENKRSVSSFNPKKRKIKQEVD